jgi:hypothetical protein
MRRPNSRGRGTLLVTVARARLCVTYVNDDGQLQLTSRAPDSIMIGVSCRGDIAGH